jgi:hypothetical protein
MPTTSPESPSQSSTGGASGGFAAAVTPVAATTRHTSDDGIVAGFVEIAVGDDRIPVYMLRNARISIIYSHNRRGAFRPESPENAKS